MPQLFLEKLNLTYFKNYEEARFEFSECVNCVVGENGSGKTNLLDAVYTLALSKSAFQTQDALMVQHEANFMLIDGVFQKDQKAVQITCSLQRGQRKVLLSDKKPYERLSDHIGRFLVVLIAPNDTDLIRDGSEDRRRFIDGVLSQLEQPYLQDLLQYNRILAQRNSILKQFAERNYTDHELLDSYDEPLLMVGTRIFERRKTFLQNFVPLVQKYYDFLGESREKVEIVFESELANATFADDFRRQRFRDLQAQRTTMGIHKDDFGFEMNGAPLRKFGSQGQQKSFVVALKLAQFDLMHAEKNTKPILLLDDIFDKLDDRRIQKLIELMDMGTFGQIFLTDARPERTTQLLSNAKTEVRFLKIETGD
ncbi:MAG: DNA replication and repair protein RecF [Runella slithyformis]|nr:MAG: DNA replication and repair protein RecF [Runella slithyformis]TAE97802.1 MAG: DNA replication and repair protein RecF [Runella slithyformis]TAF23393.1 MAG: DNA replication and repair protein RecF [Runella slithyformis]TAF47847.1 MAG: DNA replication and repair protein RecF [Runella slithyformis]TAF78648.1 MAG: DNA replication and repair protein RecF [Runella slithyformis]